MIKCVPTIKRTAKYSMRMLLEKKMLAIALAVFAVHGAKADTKPDPSIGTWKLNVKESIAPQGKTFTPYTVVIRSAFPVLDYTYYDVDEKGNKVEFSWKAPPDGKVVDVPGVPGMKGSMTLLPSGIVDAKLWSSDGTYENKFCILDVSLRKQTCMAQVTSPQGDVVFFKQVIEKQD